MILLQKVKFYANFIEFDEMVQNSSTEKQRFKG